MADPARPPHARLAAGVMLGIIRIYWYTLSPLLGGQCRFHPTCSRYADEAIRRHGPWIGGRLAIRRIGRCHPFGGSGFDPVPDEPRRRGK
ncbi:MAG: membrane protein insertion efficiency factor YidD [Phycisphaerales bacterium JB039]